jgi:hypothetical protein
MSGTVIIYYSALASDQCLSAACKCLIYCCNHRHRFFTVIMMYLVCPLKSWATNPYVHLETEKYTSH